MKKLLFAVGQVLVPVFLIAQATPPRAPVAPAGAGLGPSRETPVSHPRVKPQAWPRSAAPTAALPLAATPPEMSDIASRLRAARAAAAAPGQPVPHPSTASAGIEPAPLASRIGADVTLVRRPGVGTPMQIRGERLQLRR